MTETLYLYRCQCGNLKGRDSVQKLAPSCESDHVFTDMQLIGSIEIEEVRQE